jgi:RNA polymerase sigma-70 factor (ECF subfamily)
LLDLRAALALLPDDQREAIILVGAAGHSCQEAAKIAGCAVGTIKSRVSRARRRLVEILTIPCGGELHPASFSRRGVESTVDIGQNYL